MTVIYPTTIDKFMAMIANDIYPLVLTKAQQSLLKNSLEQLVCTAKLEQVREDKVSGIKVIKEVFKEERESKKESESKN